MILPEDSWDPEKIHFFRAFRALEESWTSLTNGSTHERLCSENKVLHLMFYYELELYWMKVC
jgi:hypothetical protein